MMYEITHVSHLLGEVGSTEVEYLCFGTSAASSHVMATTYLFDSLVQQVFPLFFDTRTC